MLIPLTDEQQIDYTLSEMLGAWQLGDSEKLRQDYADDVAIVNGSWAPPILGWTNYLAVYQPAACAHAAGAHGSHKYLYQSEWYGGLGVLPVGFRSSLWMASRQNPKARLPWF